MKNLITVSSRSVVLYSVLLAILMLDGPLQGRTLVYEYIEGENYSSARAAAFRDEGFTTWMGHPSGGRTVVFDTGNAPANTACAKYDLSRLADGQYFVFIRHLAFSSPCASVEVGVNNQSLGVTDFDDPGTRLAWSKRLGPFTKSGPVDLVLRPVPNANAPYVDVILLTNDPTFLPDNIDRDYRSSKMEIVEDGLAFGGLQMAGFKGHSEVSLVVTNPTSQVRPVTAKAWGVDLLSHEMMGAERSFALKPGPNPVNLGLSLNEGAHYVVSMELSNRLNQTVFYRTGSCSVQDRFVLAINSLCVTEPSSPLEVFLRINDPALMTELRGKSLTVTMRGGDQAQPLFVAKNPVMKSECKVRVPVGSMSNGRYTVTARLEDDGNVTGRFQVSKITPSNEKLEDIRQVTLKNNTILVNGRPFVPRKLYHAPGAKWVKEQGFNAVDCWGNDTLEGVQAMLDEAHANNLYGFGILYHPYFYKGIDKGYDLEALKRGVEKLKNHPALLFWELYDEPDAGVPVNQLEEAYALIKKLDPNHPVLLNFCFENKYREYAGPCDMVSQDFYPVPLLPLHMLAAKMDKLGAAVDFKKPLQCVLQTYGDHTGGAKGRMPTPEELRCMTYLAINHGARSLTFYSYAEGKGYPFCLENDRLLWSYLRDLNDELMAMRDFIVAQPVCDQVACSNSSIDLSVRKTEGQWWIAAANVGGEDLKGGLQLKENALEGVATVLFERIFLFLFERDGVPISL